MQSAFSPFTIFCINIKIYTLTFVQTVKNTWIQDIWKLFKTCALWTALSEGEPLGLGLSFESDSKTHLLLVSRLTDETEGS